VYVLHDEYCCNTKCDCLVLIVTAEASVLRAVTAAVSAAWALSISEPARSLRPYCTVVLHDWKQHRIRTEVSFVHVQEWTKMCVTSMPVSASLNTFLLLTITARKGPLSISYTPKMPSIATVCCSWQYGSSRQTQFAHQYLQFRYSNAETELCYLAVPVAY
jgi:hypothetical protein